jgi:hypothetical protein
MANDYHIITEWRFRASEAEIRDILADATSLPRWWPAVYLAAERTQAGDADHVGETIRLFTKGYLPYTLRWDFVVTSAEPLTLEARGDFVGRGIWTFQPDGDDVTVRYDWKIHAEKPLLKALSGLMKPIFVWNHNWAMETGRQSVELELARRRAKSDAERAQIAAPPPPTPSNTLAWLLMLIRRR